jgi:endonuclease/exonuclease/phosphatase family metal-dependent hydrolase
LRNFLRKILLIVNVLLAGLLIITYLSANVSPATLWIFAFLALSYPFILFLNLLFIVIWIIFRKWYFLLSLACILLGWKALRSSFQVHFKDPVTVSRNQTSLHLVTYNVRLFNYYQWIKDTTAWQTMVDFIHAENPDVVCFQEFITLPGTHHDFEHLKKEMEPLSYSHVYYTDQVPGRISFGMATFSKYPIVGKKMIDFKESLNGSISTDILINQDTVRIYNCHLQSIRLRKDYDNMIDSLIFNYSDRQMDEIKDISVRMKQAYIQRADQVDLLSEDIGKSPYPVIVCGDFNDTPVSYTYKTLSKGMSDAFIESGSGIGTTFRGNFPYVRIDYVLYGPEFTSYFYKTEKVIWSDHYPVTARFTLNEMADSSGLHSPPKE